MPPRLSTVECGRQVIKSDYATITFVEVEFEIPPRQRGEVTTVEGLLRSSAERLGEAQDIRMEQAPEVCVVTVRLHRLAVATVVERLHSVGRADRGRVASDPR